MDGIHQYAEGNPRCLALDDEDVCDIKAAFHRALLPIYARVIAATPFSKEAEQRRAMDDMLQVVFSERYRPQAGMNVE
jgi:hypothetical protein